MLLTSLVLQNFRSYSQKKFDFSPTTTIIIGPNTAGKTNLAEAIHILATGKSFKGPTDVSLIQFGKEIGRVKGLIIEGSMLNEQKEIARVARNDKTMLEVVFASPSYNGRFSKKYLVNEIPKSRTNFLGFLPLVLFRPEELDIIIDGPSVRRDFLDEVLEQVDREYVHALVSYTRAIRQRNALLYRTREEGYKNEKQFKFWDELVIQNGQKITEKREAFINWLNEREKDVVNFHMLYDHSKISEERLLQYKDAEIASAVTLVGPHRDDFSIELMQDDGQYRDVRVYGSRGQQRLVVLQLKLLQIVFITEKLQKKPLLVLDDIFSELDSGHIQLVLDKVSDQQAIITTTHKEFIPKDKLKEYSVIELGKQERLID